MHPRIDPNAIDLLCKSFGDHERGLPEWLKNSREAYLRAGAPTRESRLIGINMLGSARRDKCSGVECWDFVGVAADDIYNKLLVWAKPDAAVGGVADASAIEGGQGNGGKAYGRELFETYYFISIRDGLLSVLTFQDDKKFVLDFLPNAKGTKGDVSLPGMGVTVRGYADKVLSSLGKPRGSNITIVRGEEPKQVISSSRVVALLQRAAQARESLETCDVRIFDNMKPQKTVRLDHPPPHRDFPDARTITIPAALPFDGRMVSTTKAGFDPGKLVLQVANLRLRAGQWSGRSLISIHGKGPKSIGEWLTSELDLPRPELRDHIYGDLSLPLLVDPADTYEKQGRRHLKEGPLSFALKAFVEDEVAKLIGELEKATEIKTVVEKKKALEKLHERFEKWIESKLADMEGAATEGKGEGTGRKPREKRPPKVHLPLAALRINRGEVVMCRDATYQLRAVGEDADGKPVPTGTVVWKSDAPTVVFVNEDSGLLTPLKVGSCLIQCSTLDGSFVADPASVTVFEADLIDITNDEPINVSPNRRRQLGTEVVTKGGDEIKNPVLQWTIDDDSVAHITQDGVLIGRTPGTTIAHASSGDVKSASVEILVELGKHGDLNVPTSARPRILLSGIHPDPLTREIVYLHASDPPVHQRPGEHDFDTNTWWINLQTPLAEALRKHGPASLQWRNYHFQRVIDVWVRVALVKEYADREVSANVLVNFYDDKMTSIYQDAATEILDLVSQTTISMGEDE